MMLTFLSKDGEDQVEHVHECDEYCLTRNKDQMIFKTFDKTGMQKQAIVINGETPRRIYVMNDSGQTTNRYYWKVK